MLLAPRDEKNLAFFKPWLRVRYVGMVWRGLIVGGCPKQEDVIG